MPSDPDIVLLGATCLDVKGQLAGTLRQGTSNAGRVRISAGGCARNIAENLARLGVPVALLSVVCQDDFGRAILQRTEQAGVNVDHVQISCDLGSAAYLALLDRDGQLVLGVDDTQTIVSLTPDYVYDHAEMLSQARFVMIDANLPLEVAEAVLAICEPAGVPVGLDPVSYRLAEQYQGQIGAFALVVPNAYEAQALTGLPVTNVDQAVLAAKALIARGVRTAVITLADLGTVYATAASSGHIRAAQVDIVDTTGASDALTAAVLYGMLQGLPLDESVRLGISAATLTLLSHETVRQDLTLEHIYAQLVV